MKEHDTAESLGITDGPHQPVLLGNFGDFRIWLNPNGSETAESITGERTKDYIFAPACPEAAKRYQELEASQASSLDNQV